MKMLLLRQSVGNKQ